MRHSLTVIFGHDDATALMEHLPPVGWADVATRRDLDNQTTVLRGELEALRLGVEASLHREISSRKSAFIWMLLASNATFASIVLAAVTLL